MLSAFYQKFDVFPVVYGDDECKQLLKPSELDIYNEPSERIPATRPPPSPVYLYENISAARKSLSGVFSGLLTTHEKVSKTISTTEDKIKSTYERTISDPSFLLTPGAICLATIGGAVVAGKGRRPIKRSVYAAVFGVTAASVSYPQRAMEIATTGYHHTISAVTQLVSTVTSPSDTKTITEKVSESIPDLTDENIGKNQNDNDEDEKPDISNQTELKQVEVREINVTSTDKEDITHQMEFDDKTTGNIEGDVGQSNPDDADMYTTRS